MHASKQFLCQFQYDVNSIYNDLFAHTPIKHFYYNRIYQDGARLANLKIKLDCHSCSELTSKELMLGLAQINYKLRLCYRQRSQ